MISITWETQSNKNLNSKIKDNKTETGSRPFINVKDI